MIKKKKIYIHILPSIFSFDPRFVALLETNSQSVKLFKTKKYMFFLMYELFTQ